MKFQVCFLFGVARSLALSRRFCFFNLKLLTILIPHRLCYACECFRRTTVHDTIESSVVEVVEGEKKQEKNANHVQISKCLFGFFVCLSVFVVFRWQMQICKMMFFRVSVCVIRSR